MIFGRPFVKRFALCYQTVVCLYCFSVCLSVSPVCNVGVLWPNGWTDQDETWHAGRPRPRPHCVTWGPSSPSLKGAQPPIFGWWKRLDGSRFKMALGMEVHGHRSSHIVLAWDTAPSPKGAEPPNFLLIYVVTKRLDASKMPLGIKSHNMRRNQTLLKAKCHQQQSSERSDR